MELIKIPDESPSMELIKIRDLLKSMGDFDLIPGIKSKKNKAGDQGASASKTAPWATETKKGGAAAAGVGVEAKSCPPDKSSSDEGLLCSRKRTISDQGPFFKFFLEQSQFSWRDQ